MTERRYTDDEVAAIFARAAESEQAAPPAAGQGLTLAALQEIGREVGIPAESIALAARSLDQTGRPASQTFLGLPIGVGRTVEFDRPLSDADWEGLVGDLRETFAARGAVRYDGPFRQWTNGNLQALVEPTPNGHRVRLQTFKGDSRLLMTAGAVMLGSATATLIAGIVAGNLGQSGIQTGITIMAAIGAGLLATAGLSVARWARVRRAQIEGVIARLANARPSLPAAGQGQGSGAKGG